MPDGRRLCRDLVRDLHVLLQCTGLSRSSIFAALYAVHIMVPILCLYLYLTRPWFRPVMFAGLAMVIATQLYARTCPIAKLEWSIEPGAEKVTWKGAEILDQFVPVVNKQLKFRYMVGTTVTGLAFLVLVSRFLPTGLGGT